VRQGIGGARPAAGDSRRRLAGIGGGRGLRGVSPPIELEVCTNTK
jgi:hypothetical protein